MIKFFVPLLSLLRSPSLPHPPIPSSPDRNMLQEQKHKGRPSSLLGGVLNGGPGGALRARCVCLKRRGEEGWASRRRRRRTGAFSQKLQRNGRVLESVGAENGDVPLSRRGRRAIESHSCPHQNWSIVWQMCFSSPAFGGSPSEGRIGDVPEMP